MEPAKSPAVEVVVPTFPPGRPLRFAVRSGDQRSRHWMVVAAEADTSVYVVPERMQHFLHFSIHEDDPLWRYTVDAGGDTTRREWTPPSAVDGARRALTWDFRTASLILPASQAASDIDVWCGGNVRTGSLLVELFLLTPDLPKVRPIGRDPVVCGGVRMVDGRVAALVASDTEAEPLPSQRLPLPPNITREQLRESADAGHLGILVFGKLSDGSLILTDTRTARPGETAAEA